MTIAHISDLHFGRISHPRVVDALVDEVNEESVDLVVLTGDLTQRARRREFESARAALTKIEPPTLVVPGNHDISPWWRPVQRLSTPLKRYRQYITDNLAPTFDRDGAAVLGLSSAYGASIKGGRIASTDRAAIRDFFGARADGQFKVLAVHHHLTRIRTIGWHNVARQARRTLQTAADAGVHLILCGHLHVSHIEPIDVIPGEHRIVIAAAGTATSNRWREPTGRVNFYNLVTVEADAFEVEERRYLPSRGVFRADGVTTFERFPEG